MSRKGFAAGLVPIAFALAACAPSPIKTPSGALEPTSETPSPMIPRLGCRVLNPDQPWVCYEDTNTPSPTLRESPTATLQPSLTPTPPPAARPLIVYGVFGGDGGMASDFYLGRDTPRLELFVDGTLIRRVCASGEGCQFLQSHLQPSAICLLRARLIETGFFDIPDANVDKDRSPIYKFDETTERSDGAPVIVIQVNGDPAQQVDIYIPYFPYLIPPMRRAESTLRNFTPIAARVYEPSTLLLWIEQGRGLAEEGESPRQWPSDFPRLADLLQSRVESPSFYEGYHVVLTSLLAKRVYALFEERMRGLLFAQDGVEYYLISRPLLPNETPDRISPFPYPANSFPLPYDCR